MCTGAGSLHFQATQPHSRASVRVSSSSPREETAQVAGGIHPLYPEEILFHCALHSLKGQIAVKRKNWKPHLSPNSQKSRRGLTFSQYNPRLHYRTTLPGLFNNSLQRWAAHLFLDPFYRGGIIRLRDIKIDSHHLARNKPS